ncbi:hypothetical protein [Parachitinimonas caeni]|uniref:Uncharacterized protein n=1 Tax=Parachitinimonas caeni TaxID=3031301 RepID=A0ABT7DVH4_9NEIS|nr:hypothetical protein [Parachitinimonas caeni]MDK2124068.1 hypothetical protein [Parachitinimonas caeni]
MKQERVIAFNTAWEIPAELLDQVAGGKKEEEKSDCVKTDSGKDNFCSDPNNPKQKL